MTISGQEKGEEFFYNEGTDCAMCHPPPYYTDFQVNGIGTASAPEGFLGPLINTHALLSLSCSAPV